MPFGSYSAAFLTGQAEHSVALATFANGHSN
jgi:hypothetical protein